MAKYKVITLAMSVKNNRIAEFGQFVDDSELTTNPSLLIEEGFIEVVEEDDVIDIESEVVETKEVVSKKDEVKAKLASKK